MKEKIIKCEKCGHKIQSEEDIIYIEDQAAYFTLKLKRGKLFYTHLNSTSLEHGNYLCRKCHYEMPFQTEPEVIDYLKSIKNKK
jgi:DNA-directed RNA polymerase subunit M/transcription elongation factor TFIIS